jgi:hypothetical protein
MLHEFPWYAVVISGGILAAAAVVTLLLYGINYLLERFHDR